MAFFACYTLSISHYRIFAFYNCPLAVADHALYNKIAKQTWSKTLHKRQSSKPSRSCVIACCFKTENIKYLLSSNIVRRHQTTTNFPYLFIRHDHGRARLQPSDRPTALSAYHRKLSPSHWLTLSVAMETTQSRLFLASLFTALHEMQMQSSQTVCLSVRPSVCQVKECVCGNLIIPRYSITRKTKDNSPKRFLHNLGLLFRH